jgi:hypothetical protein
MGQQKVYPFDNTADYTKINTVVEDGVGKLGITNNPGQSFNQPFSSDTGFTYNNTKAEFSVGQVQQIDKIAEAGILLHSNFEDNNFDADFSSGSPLGSIGGTTVPVIVTHLGSQRAFIANIGNGSAFSWSAINQLGGTVGSMRAMIVFGYAGFPTGNDRRIFYNIGTHPIFVTHETTGDLVVSITNTAGTHVFTIAAYSAVAGEHELLLCWDTNSSPNGLLYVFLDRVLQNSGTPFTFPQGIRISDGDVGFGQGGLPGISNLYIDDVTNYDSIIHTADYAVEQTEFIYQYLGSVVELPDFEYSGPGDMQSLTSFAAIAESTERYIIDGKYWNGANWIVSDLSFAQANISLDVNTNIGNLSLMEPGVVPVSIVFQDGNIQQYTGDIVIGFDGQKYQSSGSIVVIEPITSGRVNLFDAEFTEPSVNQQVRFILIVDGVDKYHDGLNWVNSNGTISQANIAQDVSDNILELINQEAQVDIYVKVLLATSDDQVTPEIDDIEFSYNDFDVCIVTADLQDLLLSVPVIDPLNPPKLHITAHRTFTLEESVVLGGSQSAAFNISGEASLSVVVTEPVGERLQFGISIPDGRGTKWIMFEPAIVPNLYTEEIQRITLVRATDFG